MHQLDANLINTAIESTLLRPDLQDITQDRMDTITKRTVAYDRHIKSLVTTSSPVAFNTLNTTAPRSPTRAFNYLDELAQLNDDMLQEDQLLNEVARFFNGAIDPSSKYSLFNIIPQPDVDAAAAFSLVSSYNLNCLMDAFGGESLLVEQQVVRTVGKWVGWQDAMGIACNGGKLTILYAIRAALSRLAPGSLRDGLPSNIVILCSEGGHYCVEHIASQLGLGSKNCWRVASSSTGKMCPESFSALLNSAHNQGNEWRQSSAVAELRSTSTAKTQLPSAK